MGWDAWLGVCLFGGLGTFLYLALLACEYRWRAGLEEIRELLKKKNEIEKQKRKIREDILWGTKTPAQSAVNVMAQEKPRAVAGLIEKIMAEKTGAPAAPPPTGKPGAAPAAVPATPAGRTA